MTQHDRPAIIRRGHGMRWRVYGLGSLVTVLMLSTLMAPLIQGAPAHAQADVASSGDTVIAAAGDIACDPTDSAYNGGNGTSRHCQQKWTAAELAGVTDILPLGDEQYQCASLSAFEQSYDPTWGQYKAIEHPAIGNHEYYHGCPGPSVGASGYFTYFGAAATPLQPTCTAKCKGYYSFNIGAWHIIALNSECNQIGGCNVGSGQEKWLKKDLAANPTACTLVYWHRPYFTSGGSLGDTQMHDIWVDLYNAHVDIVLNGHDHIYERFAPQDANAVATPNGVTEFIVGTGGDSHGSISSIADNSVVHDNTTYGVLKLTLYATSYSWQFVPDGKSGTFTDSGSASCV